MRDHGIDIAAGQLTPTRTSFAIRGPWLDLFEDDGSIYKSIPVTWMPRVAQPMWTIFLWSRLFGSLPPGFDKDIRGDTYMETLTEWDEWLRPSVSNRPSLVGLS